MEGGISYSFDNYCLCPDRSFACVESHYTDPMPLALFALYGVVKHGEAINSYP